MVRLFYRRFEFVANKIYRFISKISCTWLFYVKNVKHSSFNSAGIPILNISPLGQFIIGEEFVMVNEAYTATLGKNNKCKFVVGPHAKLELGAKIGMSNTTIVATRSVKLGNNIVIGGGVTIIDSDFHSMNYRHWHTSEDEKNMKSIPVVINDNVFIGMNTIILKGVTIGTNVAIAAGSVVTKSIPDNQIWGGNPARFISDHQI